MREQVGEQTIRVVVSFDGSLQGVYWLHRGGSRVYGSLRTLWIGEVRGVTIPCAAPELPAEKFPLVRERGDGYKLLCPSALFDGRLQLGQQAATLSALCEAGLAVPCADYPEVFEIALRPGMECRLSLGLLLVQLMACKLPRRLALTPTWRFRPHLSTAFITLFVVAVAALAAALPAAPTPLWGWQSPEPHIAPTIAPGRASGVRVFFTPSLQSGSDRDAKEPIGFAKNPTRSKGRAALTPSRRPAPAAPSTATASSSSAAPAIFAQLIGQKSVLGDAAATMNEVHGGDGDGGGTIGGLVGTGGGSGDGAVLLGELGGLGGPGKRGATCSDASCEYGTNVGSLCGRSVGGKRSCYSSAGPAVVADVEVSCKTARVCSYNKDVIRRVIRQHINEVRHCYERALISQPTLTGRVGIRFLIDARGQVERSEVATSTVADPGLGSCIADAVRRWQFPSMSDGSIEVNYPFELQLP